MSARLAKIAALKAIASPTFGQTQQLARCIARTDAQYDADMAALRAKLASPAGQATIKNLAAELRRKSR